MPKRRENERYLSIHVPEGVYHDLARLAHDDHRSLQKEVLFLLALGMVERGLAAARYQAAELAAG
jgi:hypothetical protein